MMDKRVLLAFLADAVEVAEEHPEWRKKMACELNDYQGPLDESFPAHYEEFSKDFLIQIIRTWLQLFDDYEVNMQELADTADIPGLDAKVMEDLERQSIAEIVPSLVMPIVQTLAEGNEGISFSAFNKKLILCMMRIWAEVYESYQSGLVKLAPDLNIPNFDSQVLMQMQLDNMRKILPPIKEQWAEICGLDLDKLPERIKTGRFIPDYIADHYTNSHYEVLSDTEVTLTFDECYLYENDVAGSDPAVKYALCWMIEPAFAEATDALPGRAKVSVSMDWAPPFDGNWDRSKPICRWRFKQSETETLE